MAITATAVSTGQVKQHFLSLDSYLTQLAALSGLTVDDLVKQHVRGATSRLQKASRLRFFQTRFCTRELASQESLVAGTHYDEECDPLDFIADQWSNTTVCLDLPWIPIVTLTLIRISMDNGGKIADLPAEWLQKKPGIGEVNLYPYQTGMSSVIWYQFTQTSPLLRFGMTAGVIPGIIHPRYTAGLVSSTSYNPTAYPKTSQFDADMVEDYQAAIRKLAASDLMTEIASGLDNGGISLSFDGMSQSVNSDILRARAELLQGQALQWAEERRHGSKGPDIAFP